MGALTDRVRRPRRLPRTLRLQGGPLPRLSTMVDSGVQCE
jgi:hypothetical protein